MAIGALSEPLPYSAPDGTRGFRVFYLKSRTAPHKANLTDDYSRIQNAALNLKRVELVQTWFTKTREKTYVKIDESYLGCDNLTRWQ